MIIPKNVILTELRNRGLHQRADFVDKQLPDDIDPARHGGLLATLHLDLKELAAAAAISPDGSDKPA
jgi:hypothetical protein